MTVQNHPQKNSELSRRNDVVRPELRKAAGER
ncbi:uncharacterized protein G2W53_027662 [Senna tora]|uniref:Uncharacterized protein n=1 Tax=Senna tora TaxID=362788 RepID=A0A834TH98_9FABA|nr:uncharacterized protein G2W53_027662 [Senna tora]